MKDHAKEDNLMFDVMEKVNHLRNETYSPREELGNVLSPVMR